MNSDQILIRAINLIDAGNKADGRELLKQALQTDPNNVDVLFVYAQYCGKRDQAVAALNQVLKLDPDYPGATEALDRISLLAAPTAETLPPQPAFVSLEQDDPWSQSIQADAAATPIVPGKLPPHEKKANSIPKWFVAVTTGLLGCLLLGGLVVGSLFLSRNIEIAKADAAPTATQTAAGAAISIATATLQPYATPTSTPDPCTCEAVNAYMTEHLPRVNQLLSEMESATKKLRKKSLKEQDAATLVENATKLYDEQRAQGFPPCLESYQKDAVKMFWTWEQTTLSIQNGDTNGALAFTQIISADSSKLDEKLTKLAGYPTLQSCNFAFPTLTAPKSWTPGSLVMACGP